MDVVRRGLHLIVTCLAPVLGLRIARQQLVDGSLGREALVEHAAHGGDDGHVGRDALARA